MRLQPLWQRSVQRCLSLISITFSETLISIGNRAFYGNTAVTSLDLPETLQTIGDQAFHGISNVSNLCFQVQLKPSVKTPFLGLALEMFAVDVTKSLLSVAIFGVLYDKDMTTLIAYPASRWDLMSCPHQSSMYGWRVLRGMPA